jgi:WD40 repeat protein
VIALREMEVISISNRPLDALMIDEDHLLVIDAEGRVLKISFIDGSQENLFETPIGGNQFSLSKSKGVLACSGPDGYAIYDIAARSLKEHRRGEWSAVSRWHQSGELVLSTFGRKVALLNFEGSPIFESEEMSSTVTDVSWIGDDFAIASYGGVTVIKNQRRQSIKREFVGSLLCLATSPSGDWIVSGNQDASLQVYKTSDDTRLEMEGFARKVTIASFNRDGKWLANNGADEVTVWSFAGKGPKGRSPVMLPRHIRGATAISWHPVSPNLVATGDGSGLLRIWDLNLGLQGKPLVPHTALQLESNASIKSILWGHDGESFAAVQDDGCITRNHFK